MSILNSLACMYTQFHIGSSKFGQFCCICGSHFHCNNRTLHFLWCVILKAVVLNDNGKFVGIPILLRVIYRDQFVRGPFHLGKFSYPIALGAVIWILFISIAFILPQANVKDLSEFR